jgi:Domain of unknown function (DUF4190)
MENVHMSEAVRTPLPAPAAGRESATAPVRPGRDEQAVAALVLALAGYLALPVVPSVMAIREGVAARRRLAGSDVPPGRWMATAGVLLGVVELALTALIVIGLIWFPLLVPGG